ncbi:AAA domain-containing protein [Alkaliphilus transvaalensis]|uniref:AAA domain-containing protein n=1 Tax=Alkaliphilus transvaalensis TaxID=114628 RepID=UPI00047AE881|nr:AAA domain-containing protein [Alkaliphilus transvaalensis]
MREIFSKYKERLINLSSRNRSLVLKKVYKKRAFDLHKLISINENIDQEILNLIISGTEQKLMLLDDPYKIRISKIKEAEVKSKEAEEKEIEELVNKELTIQESQQKKELIQKKFQEELKLTIDKIEKRIETIIDYSTSLTYLEREINALEKETGRYELFMGYPFVEGRFQDNTFVRAPLLLIPVKILKENNKWYIKNISDQDILINKVFIFAYGKYNETKIKEFNTEFSTLTEFGEDVIDGLLKYLHDNKMVIQDIANRKIEKFIDYTEKNLPQYKVGELMLKNHIILGQFPISNSIYNDYQQLEKIGEKNQLLSKLLLNDGQYEIQKDKEEGKLTISEEDLYLLNSLDYSQEIAVKRVNETNQLVIYGPPGTGKSQTIANIIGDALVKGKKILMVSQKRAALDVIYNRLAGLNSKIILIHDANKDKKDFYEKVSQTLENNILGSKKESVSTGIKAKAKVINEGIQSLEKIANILHQQREFGLTLQQMYAKTKNINSKDDQRFDDYRGFRRNNSLKNYNYKQLNEAIKNISDDIILDNYLDYRDMVTDNRLLEDLKPSFDYLEAQEVNEFIDEIMKSVEIVKSLLANNNYQLLIDEYKASKFPLRGVAIDELTHQINKTENNQLLEPLNTGKWWSIIYWLNYGKNKKQEESNKKDFEEKGNKIHSELEAYQDIIVKSLKNTTCIRNVLMEETYYSVAEELLKGELTKEKLIKIADAIEDYEKYREVSYKVNILKAIEKELLEYAYSKVKDKQAVKRELSRVLEYVILINITEIEKEMGDTSLLDYSRFDELTNKIYGLMAEKNQLTPELILQDWNQKTYNLMSMPEFREFKRQANKKKMLWPLRKYITEFQSLIFNTFPCWLLSPETVSDMLPLTEGMFDLIIFDEASQLFIENAIPTIFRGKQVVVAGDDQQLKPTSMFKVKFDDADEDDLSIDTAAALEEESLLDLAKVNYDSVHLNYHYRSYHDELINFSNYAFYGGNLQVSPNISRSNANQLPIERIKVKGTWIDRKNTMEAIKTVELVANILKNRDNNETIGIITFNISQKDLIEDLLERKASLDPAFKVKYAAEIDRKDGNEDLSIFVKNIENVQGDERDIIIFSVGYAPNESGKVSVNFGALSQDGGENRLNVAISRAKQKIYVITSIEPEELRVDHTKNRGPKLFKKYLQYVKAVSESRIEEANQILYSLVDSDIKVNKEMDFDSDFEMEVADALTERGYDVHTQVGVSGYKIDLAIYDEASSRYILGIECDGATYHSSKSARERDIHRQRYLESRGWNIIRIWSRNWWQNPISEIAKIEKKLKTCIKISPVKKKDKLLNLQINQANEVKSTIIDKSIEQQRSQREKIAVKPALRGNLIDYGDYVILKDILTNETFEIQLEENKYNRHHMKEIERKLLGHRLQDQFIYKGATYEVIKAEPIAYKQN